MKIKSLTYIFSAAALISACGGHSQDETESASVAEQPRVESFELQKSASRYEINLPGELKPFEEVNIYSKIQGFVKEIKVDRGSRVKKGEVLAILDVPEIAQNFLAAKAHEQEVLEQLAYSRQAYKRLEKAASREGAVATLELEEAQAKLRRDSASYLAAKADLQANQALKNYAVITAPFEAVVTSKMVSPGAFVGQSTGPLFHLSEQERLRLEVALPGKHADAIGNSAEVSFTVNALPGEIFTARISRSSQVLDAGLRSVMLEFDVDNKNGKLAGGEYARVHLPLSRSTPVFKVPASAVVTSESSVYVVKIDNGKTKYVPVKTGMEENGKIEVFGQLHEGDKVVKKASGEIREGIIASL